MRFEKYCEVNSLISKPIFPIVVAMYITHLLDQGKTDSVISSAVYGIKWAHNVNDLVDPTDSNIVKLFMETSKRIPSKPTEEGRFYNGDVTRTLLFVSKM